jgi:hypothetical protein
MTMTIEERVLNGAAALDRTTPGWESKVNIETLDMKSTTKCVLGQVFDGNPAGWSGNGYLAGTTILGLTIKEGGTAQSHGFSADCDSSARVGPCSCETEFDALTAAWKKFIFARRNAIYSDYIVKAQARVMA